MTTDGPGQQTAGRPRSEEAHQAILDATLELLVEVGFSALTVEGVASRAGVGKATIYRRWPSKLPLVVEAFGQLPGFEEVDTGNVEEDLKQMLRHYIQAFNSTPLSSVLPSSGSPGSRSPPRATRAWRSPPTRRRTACAPWSSARPTRRPPSWRAHGCWAPASSCTTG